MQKRSLLVMSGLGVLCLTGLTDARDAAAVPSSGQKKDSLNIGWVSQTAVSKSKEGKELEKVVMAEHRKQSLEVERLQKLYADLAADFNAKAAALSADAREVEGEKVAKAKRDYEDAVGKAERVVQREMQKATQEALKSFTLAAEDYAKEKGYDVLLSEAGAVYVNKNVDGTNEIAAIMDTRYEVKLAQNKKSVDRPAVKTAAAPASKDAKAAPAA